MTKNLTEKQNNVLDFIKKFSATHGYPPSIREIGKGLGLSSPATVHTHVKNLCKRGYLKVDNNKFRAMEILVDNEYETKNEELIKHDTLANKVIYHEERDNYVTTNINGEKLDIDVEVVK